MSDKPVIVSTSESRIGRLRDFTQSLFAGGSQKSYNPGYYNLHPNSLFAVICIKDGGAAGDGTSTCSWTYTVKTIAGKEIGTTKSPDKPRIANVEYEVPNALGVRGIAYIDAGGGVRLYDVCERPVTEECP